MVVMPIEVVVRVMDKLKKTFPAQGVYGGHIMYFGECKITILAMSPETVTVYGFTHLDARQAFERNWKGPQIFAWGARQANPLFFTTTDGCDPDVAAEALIFLFKVPSS
jgi:hypothetical protein